MNGPTLQEAKLGLCEGLGSYFYAQKPKEIRLHIFDSRAGTGILVGFIWGSTYKVSLDNDKSIVERRDVQIDEGHREVELDRANMENTVELDMSDENIIFDDCEMSCPSSAQEWGSDNDPNYKAYPSMNENTKMGEIDRNVMDPAGLLDHLTL